ncbi:MAG TPA: hypothetical protein VFZ66_21245 [Herpetosiphonaceae bacterium]
MEQSQTSVRFAICIRNIGAEDLALRKVYQILPSTSSAEDGFLRVIDESGEDYLYPADYFILLDLPQSAERALLQAA